jgi:hypothetical protein
MERYMRSKIGFAVLDRIAAVLFIVFVVVLELLATYMIVAAFLTRGFAGEAVVTTIVLVVVEMVVVAMLACTWMVAVIVLCDIAKAKGASTDGLQLVGYIGSPVLLALIVIALPQKPVVPQQPVPVLNQSPRPL